MTLNLLRNGRINPKLLSWVYINGCHDFNRHPLAPPGTKLIIHSKPSNRSSWAFHGRLGWYVGPATSHYRCVKYYIKNTRSEVISDTVKFIPSYVPIPAANIDDLIRHSFSELIHLLKTRKTIFPNHSTQQNGTEALLKLSNILHNNTRMSNQVHPPLVTSDGGGTGVNISNSLRPQEKITYPKIEKRNKTQKITDAEFQKILDNVSKNKSNKNTAQPNGCSPPIINKLPSKNSSTKSFLMNHMFDIQGKKQSLDKLLVGSTKKIWQQALSNELGRLAQGIGTVQGNDVLDLDRKSTRLNSSHP